MEFFINILKFPLFYQIPPSLISSIPNLENNIMKDLFYFQNLIHQNFLFVYNSQIIILNLHNNDIFDIIQIIPIIFNNLIFPENNNMYCHPKLYNHIINEIKELQFNEKYSIYKTLYYNNSIAYYI